MNIAIIGTGGVGGYFGGRLAKAGNEVTFLARGEHLKALRENGLRVFSIDGDFTVYPALATDKPEELGKPELILVCVKAWQVKEVAKQLLPALRAETLVIPLQNGVLAAEELIEIIPEKHIAGGSCRIISKIEAPGIIHHLGVEPTLIFGELDHTITSRMEALLRVLSTAGFYARLTEDIHAELWKKFIVINVSGLMAVTHTTYGVMREDPEIRPMMISLIREIYAISQKMKINIAADFIDKTVEFIDTFPYDSTSSLTRDVWEGKPSEIEYQNGTVVRLGKKFGVPTPLNDYIYTSILPLEKKARMK